LHAANEDVYLRECEGQERIRYLLLFEIARTKTRLVAGSAPPARIEHSFRFRGHPITIAVGFCRISVKLWASFGG
jgi:hypothetical protein